MSLLDKASLIQIPSGYKNGKLYSVKPTPTYGSELVTNGDFATDSDWTKGTGVTISGGKANWSNTANNIGISQNGILSFGKVYRVEFTISNYSSGSLRVRFPKITERLYANGTYVYYITAENNNLFLQGELQNGNPTFSVDNVSVKEVLNDGDFTFSRSSSGTRVNSEGLIEVASVLGSEEIVNGDFATDSDWTLVGTATISNGKAHINSPSGELAEIYQNNILEIGKNYILNCDLEKTSGDTQFVNGGTFILNNGYNVIEFTANDTRAYFKRGAGSVISSIDNVSVKEVFENDVPRLDYSGGASCASLLLEPQRTNLVTYSEDFTQWSNISSTVTPNYGLSPDGTNNATRLQRTAGVRGVIYKGTSLTSGQSYTVSLYVKSLNGTQKIRIGADNGCVNPQGAETFTIEEKWQRISTTITSNQVNWNYFIDNVESGIGCTGTYLGVDILIYGFQLEQGSYPTS